MIQPTATAATATAKKSKFGLCTHFAHFFKAFAHRRPKNTLNTGKNWLFTYCDCGKLPENARKWPIFGNETRFNLKKCKWGYQWQNAATDTQTKTRCKMCICF